MKFSNEFVFVVDVPVKLPDNLSQQKSPNFTQICILHFWLKTQICRSHRIWIFIKIELRQYRLNPALLKDNADSIIQF